MAPDIRAIAKSKGLVLELDLGGSFVSRVHDTPDTRAGKGSAGPKGVQEVFIGGCTETHLQIASENIRRRRKAGGGKVLFCGSTSLVAMSCSNSFRGTG